MEIKRPFSTAEWLETPEPVRGYIEMLEKSILQLSGTVAELKGRTEKLEQRVNRNSQNSNQPPSADGPFKKPERKRKKGKRKRGGQKGHPGHRQQLLEPTETVPVKPDVCICGNPEFDHVEAFYTHQQIELPKIELKVTHYVLHKGCCSRCGRSVSSQIGLTATTRVWSADECSDCRTQWHAWGQPQGGSAVFKLCAGGIHLHRSRTESNRPGF